MGTDAPQSIESTVEGDRARRWAGTLTVAVPVVSRSAQLEGLLRSLSRTPPARVVVADNGHTPDREHLYARDWPFDLDALDLPEDCGIGRARNAAAAAVETEFALVCDCDMRAPEDWWTLASVVDADPGLGAVGGVLNERGHLRSGCTNLHEERLWGNRRALVQSIRDPPELETIRGQPVARFEKITNAMVARRECLEDGSWDRALNSKTHLDWFRWHWTHTDWDFGVCPGVIFEHRTATDGEYWRRYRGGNERRLAEDERYFREKWGYDEVITGRLRWFGTAPRSLPERVYKAIEPSVPTRVIYPVKRAVEAVEDLDATVGPAVADDEVELARDLVASVAGGVVPGPAEREHSDDESAVSVTTDSDV